MRILPTYIRKTPKGRAYEIPGNLGIIAIFFIIISIIGAIAIISSTFSQENGENLINLLRLFNPLIFFVVGFIFLRKRYNINKIKNFKNKGGGIIKKLQISSIERFITHSKGGSNGYYLLANEGFSSYCSNLVKDGDIESVLINSNFDKIYKKYGYEYDENETHKQDVLKEIDRCKAEEEYDAQNGGFLKKLTIKGKSLFSKDERKIVEIGYQTPYLIVNGHKISVGDTVDIYIDPDNERNYRMDTDFLFDR